MGPIARISLLGCLVNEHYKASLKGITDVMGFYNFLPYCKAKAGLHGVIRG
jgi:hypothetical protein